VHEVFFETRISDRDGVVGTGLQTLLVAPVAGDAPRLRSG